MSEVKRNNRILVIDDSADCLRLLTDILESASFRVFLAESGSMGLKVLPKAAPDLILLDIKMPGIDGFEVCRRLKEMQVFKDIPIIFMSSLIEVDDKVAAFRAGGVDYITKPLQREEVLVRVETHIAISQMQESIKKRNARLQNEIIEHKKTEDELKKVHDELETRIKQRTAKLAKANEKLKEEIYQRKKIEADLKRRVLAMDNSSDTIVITDTKGTISYVNPAFEKITGYSSKEALGMNPSVLQSGVHDAQFYKELWETITCGETWSGHLINKRKDGSKYTEEATISPVFSEKGKIVSYVAVKRDISDRLRLESQLKQAQKMETIGTLAGGIAHDFNNALSVIIGFTEIALDDIDPERQLYEDLNEVHLAAKRAADITRQLLAFARKQAIVPKILDLNENVGSMLKMIQRLIGENIDLAWLPGANLWSVKMDPTQIDQILANLCVNARDAIEGVGKVTIESENTSLTENYCDDHIGFVPGEFVQLSVSDNGFGMNKEILENIFEPFFTTKDVDKGTGLGLSTVYGIVKQNNGFINVYSEPDKGTTIKIYLPRHKAETFESHKKSIEEIPISKGETILVVEDDPSILNIMQKILEHLGYTVLTSSVPKKTMDIVKEYTGRIHLLITDVIMPKMNGRDLAEQLQSDYPDLKCIFMSGYSSDAIAHQEILDEKVNFIQKPFSRSELAKIVRKVLDEN